MFNSRRILYLGYNFNVDGVELSETLNRYLFLFRRTLTLHFISFQDAPMMLTNLIVNLYFGLRAVEGPKLNKLPQSLPLQMVQQSPIHVIVHQ